MNLVGFKFILQADLPEIMTPHTGTVTNNTHSICKYHLSYVNTVMPEILSNARKREVFLQYVSVNPLLFILQTE